MNFNKTNLEAMLKNSEKIISEHITLNQTIQKKLELFSQDTSNTDANHTKNQMRNNAEKINQYIKTRCEINNALAYLKTIKEIYTK